MIPTEIRFYKCVTINSLQTMEITIQLVDSKITAIAYSTGVRMVCRSVTSLLKCITGFYPPLRSSEQLLKTFVDFFFFYNAVSGESRIQRFAQNFFLSSLYGHFCYSSSSQECNELSMTKTKYQRELKNINYQCTEEMAKKTMGQVYCISRFYLFLFWYTHIERPLADWNMHSVQIGFTPELRKDMGDRSRTCIVYTRAKLLYLSYTVECQRAILQITYVCKRGAGGCGGEGSVDWPEIHAHSVSSIFPPSALKVLLFHAVPLHNLRNPKAYRLMGGMWK